MPDPLADLPPRFLHTKEAAYFLGLSRRTLEKHRTYGTGPVYLEIGAAFRNVCNQVLERIAAINAETAFAFIGIGSDDLDATGFGIMLDRVGLVFCRILLMVRRHADVFGSPNRTFRL